jgi:hypothetical protein
LKRSAWCGNGTGTVRRDGLRLSALHMSLRIPLSRKAGRP